MTCETAASTSYSCSGTTNPSVTSTYAYNGDGLRMSDTPAGGFAQQFTWDVTGSVPELPGRHQDYLYGPNISAAPLEQITISGNTPSYSLSDTTGVRQAVNASGSQIGSTMSYDTYGNCSGCSTSTTSFGFEGGYTDGTGLVYLINRYYDPKGGGDSAVTTEQFLAVDSLV